MPTHDQQKTANDPVIAALILAHGLVPADIAARAERGDRDAQRILDEACREAEGLSDR